MRPSLKTRVQRRLSELAITPAQATRRGGLTRTLIYDILDGTRAHVRTDTALKLAEALDCDVSYITGEQTLPRRNGFDAPQQPQAISQVRVVGEIAAGVWHESAAIGVYDPDLPADTDRYPPVPAVVDDRYRGFKQLAVKVNGTSVNKVIPDGFFAVFVPYWEVRGEPRDGDLVVVERRRGGLHEGTIKRLRKNGAAWQLWPDSHDPKYQTPTSLTDDLAADRDDRDITVEIMGLVVWIGAPVE
jgi:hypothetical protein